jgi:hypothetical protein
MYTELYWCSSKVESCSGVSPIRGNCNGVYLINPSKSGSNLITLPQMWWFSVIYLMHAESLGSGCVQVGEDLHVPVFMAKHATFRVFLRKLCALAIEKGFVPPLKRKNIKGLGSRNHRKDVREGRLPPL